MILRELLDRLTELAQQGQGDLPVVNDDDCELGGMEVDDGASGEAVVLEFDSHPRDFYNE